MNKQNKQKQVIYMKQIKAYLENQKEIAAANLYASLDKNLIDAKFWLERIIHVDTMIKSLDKK